MHNDVVYIFQAGTNKLRQRTGFAGFVVGYHITGWKCAVMRDHRSVDRVVYGHLSMSDKRFLIVFDLGPPFSAIWISNLAKHHHRKRKTKNFMVFFLCAFVRSLYFFFLVPLRYHYFPLVGVIVVGGSRHHVDAIIGHTCEIAIIQGISHKQCDLDK